MPGPNTNRSIRVFISSTFRDMKAERDYLVKFTFPQLRRLCESRGVTWGEVDLRWGVLDEEAADGKVLPICLEEIKRCHPYFIGILGERYGWVPQHIPDDLLAQQPWLEQHRHRSVTELEIIHGVLRNEVMHQRACFYFRDPAFVASVPEEKKADFTSETAEHAAKLERLKNDIRRARDEQICQLRESFKTPEELGACVLEDFTRIINELFPEGSQPSELERERLDHDAYARSRAQVYIGRADYFERLDQHAAGKSDQPIVIVGESGSGKSALLANWALRYHQAHRDAFVIQHYIGASPQSAEWAAMLRRIMGEFKERLGVVAEIPGDPQKLREVFPNWLYMAAAKGQVILILDALNQLEDRDGAPDLVWLPPVMPENVRLVVSTLPGRPLDETRRRHWPEMSVQPLDVAERKELIEKYLGDRSKKLSDARRQRVAGAPHSVNPLYLRVLLDELCVAAEHEELDRKIEYYLGAQSVAEIYEKVIARWEDDYEGGTDLVGDTLSLLWASRRGLSEAELLEALGDTNGPLPRARWSPLFLAMSTALVSRSGLLNFAHDFLRSAVRETYLPNEEGQKRAHCRVADYFAAEPSSPRRTDEFPWQLAEANEWQRLQDILVDREFFAEIWEKNQFEVKTYWTQIEASSPLRMVEVYRTEIEHPRAEQDKYHLHRLSFLLRDTGHPEEALRLSSELIEHFRAAGDQDNLHATLGNQALILRARGDLDGAMALHKEEERFCRQVGDLDSLSSTLGNQANILYRRGDLDGAMALYKETERICRQLGNLDSLSGTLNNQAVILQARGDLDGAMALYKETERDCRQLGNLDSLFSTLNNQANILYSGGDLDGAVVLYKEAERICRQMGDLDSLSSTLNNLANILYDRGDLDGALVLFKEAERICRQLGNVDSLSSTLGSQANILYRRADLDGAMALHQETERICRQLGNLDFLFSTLGNQALILQARGDLDGAMAQFKETEQICQRLGNMEGLALTLSNQAFLLRQKGRTREALSLIEEAHRLATRYGYGRLAGQIESDLNKMCQDTQVRVSKPASPTCVTSAYARELTTSELRDSAANALERGLWEAAETYLEKLLRSGEPIEIVAPDLIAALLNAHETVAPQNVTRIESLLDQLESAGHTALASPLREKLTVKLAASQPKNSWWKLW